ncbi:LamG-like jellyroll fold domain-containing protein [Pseudoruegeria sp. SK021]|uniref:LamG-like jellyroll fold domain-containing protein n=1 Tax=Pseudoruegeria sp. SK021 TaxID=1933035 RepID=UPI000A253EA1|nr:LamG-like jellyroll fold domain-containing protein [Pseudoruegeria sp. SK021]OSP54089.1 hypothetical protein BV911_14470 [Pseudoruegeria sp. SK021]
MSEIIAEFEKLFAGPVTPVVPYFTGEDMIEAGDIVFPTALLLLGVAGHPVLPAAGVSELAVQAPATVSESSEIDVRMLNLFDLAIPAGSPDMVVVATSVGANSVMSLGSDTAGLGARPTPDGITVTDAASLAAALAGAQDGDVIRLAGGDYGRLNLSKFDTRVTLLSDLADPAVFDRVEFQHVSGVTFDGVVFDYTYTEGDAQWHRPFRFANCQDITLQNSLVDGDTAYGRGDEKDGHGTATGLRFESCEDIRILGNEVRGFKDNVQLSGIRDLVVAGNENHHMREDAFEFSALTNALFENNHLHDTAGYPLPDGAAAGSGDHPDFFQINGGGASSANLTFRGNLMDQGSGTGAQGIFLPNRDDVPYRNITIEDNTYISDRGNGIFVGSTEGLVLRNNTILHAFDNVEDSNVPAIRIDTGSTNAVVTGNIAGTAAILNLPESWATGNNFVLQNTEPHAPDHYTEHFVNATGQLGGHPEKFLLRPDSPIYAAGAGSEYLYGKGVFAASDLTARILVSATDVPDQFVFDASMSHLPEDISGQNSAETAPNAFLRFDPATGDLVLSAADGELVVADLEPGALDLRGLEAPIGILRTGLSPLLEAGSFRLDMTLGLDPTAEGAIAGEVMRLDRAFQMNVTEKGEIYFRLKTTDGDWHRLKTTGANLSDREMHEVSLLYDAGENIQVIVDGVVLASTEIEVGMSPGVSDRMAIGGQYGARPFAGLLQDLVVTLDPESQTGGDALLMAREIVWSPADDYSFFWSFDDGSRAEGMVVEHSFGKAGYHTATMTVIGRDGSVDVVERTVGVAGSSVMDFDSQSGDFYRTAYGERVVVVDLDPGAIDLRDLDELIGIPRTVIQSMIEADEFRIDLVLSADPDETGAIGGEIMRLDRAFYVNVTNSGEIEFRLKTADGSWHRLISDGANIDDGLSHDASIRFDAGNMVQIVVDDTVLGEAPITDEMAPGIASAMVIGGQYGATAFGGLLEYMLIDLSF